MPGSSDTEINEHTDSGYVILSRDTYKKSKTWKALNPIQKIVMITLVMLANHSDGQWWDGIKKEWVPVKRGQLITSLDKLKKACGKGVSIQNIRTCFVNLEKMGFLTNQSTKHYRLVTLVKYDFYQSQENYLTKPSTKSQQSPNKALTTNNNDKHVKHENQLYIDVINYLNEQAGTKYKTTTKKTVAFIKARMSEKFTLDDFKAVVDKKVATWKGTEYEKYLRPETLFGTKFEGYLNEPVSAVGKSIAEQMKLLEDY